MKHLLNPHLLSLGVREKNARDLKLMEGVA